MIKSLLLLFCVLCLSCKTKTENQKPDSADGEASTTQRVDIAAELAAIEETRSAFQQAIKENRFGELKNYSTKNIKAYDPDCGEWAFYKALRENPSGKYHYDSLVMRPRETVIVSDSVAYDFGTSSTYYTDENGNPKELTATFLAILKKDKEDGVWKLHREVANTRELD